MTEVGMVEAGPYVAASWDATANAEWLARLTYCGPVRDEAVARLHGLMVRAARHQVHRMGAAQALGAARCEEIVLSAADEATVSVLGRLDTFEGRSRFTTWAFKFGILHAGVEVRRAAWSHWEIDLDGAQESAADTRANGPSPEGYAETRDLADAVTRAISEVLTPHQRRVAVALLVEEVPIDVLADRLGTTRNALYTTLHDARKRLREHLRSSGYLATPEEATR
jgi:RNA polymerase sigma-70 factor (ECF subfamily)